MRFEDKICESPLQARNFLAAPSVMAFVPKDKILFGGLAFFTYLVSPFLFFVGMALIVKLISFLPVMQALTYIIQLFMLCLMGFFIYLSAIMLFKLDAFFDFANQVPLIKKLPLLKWYFKTYGYTPGK